MGKFSLNWQPWAYGLFSSVIGGGAAAVSAAIGVNIMDSDKSFSIQQNPLHLFELMGICFLVNAVICTFAYLSKSPLPQVETMTQSTNIQPVGDGVKIETKTTTEQK